MDGESEKTEYFMIELTNPRGGCKLDEHNKPVDVFINGNGKS